MFRENDFVKVKSYDEIKATLDDYYLHKDDTISFATQMIKYCGKVFEIESYDLSVRHPRITLKEITWRWHPDWLGPHLIDNRRL